SPKAQMKQANNSGAAYALIIGENELANEVVSVKNLQAESMDLAQKQVDVPRAELLAYLQS
ncbi:MAG: His/Gly/Thr/Pro-type tRNA ligase C-terminal domain-containing protein, partial [Ktedonobacteraceae bacterium]